MTLNNLVNCTHCHGPSFFFFFFFPSFCFVYGVWGCGLCLFFFFFSFFSSSYFTLDI